VGNLRHSAEKDKKAGHNRQMSTVVKGAGISGHTGAGQAKLFLKRGADYD